jgi:hypothetical protein
MLTAAAYVTFIPGSDLQPKPFWEAFRQVD